MKITQKENVLAWLLAGETITQLEALDLFGVMRLAACIHKLKKDGHDIKKEMILVRTRFAGHVYVARYSLDVSK